jgi:hypothetical protein|tara:strand:- start:36 stop:413 length:378 start_codon:yes stop_codon:yes gene_type:complete
MRLSDGKPDHIEDYLITYRGGQWFGWSDSKNKIYANLIVHDGGSKPTETECTNGLAALQAAWDEKNKEYKIQRVVGVGTTAGYPNIRTQLDQLWHDIDSGKFGANAKTGDWFVGISSVKTAIAKT